MLDAIAVDCFQMQAAEIGNACSRVMLATTEARPKGHQEAKLAGESDLVAVDLGKADYGPALDTLCSTHCACRDRDEINGIGSQTGPAKKKSWLKRIPFRKGMAAAADSEGSESESTASASQVCVHRPVPLRWSCTLLASSLWTDRVSAE